MMLVHFTRNNLPNAASAGKGRYTGSPGSRGERVERSEKETLSVIFFEFSLLEYGIGQPVPEKISTCSVPSQLCRVLLVRCQAPIHPRIQQLPP